ncbi:MAG: hypothetical protein ABIC68_01910 [Candidatus Omnitrophota bacterium]
MGNVKMIETVGLVAAIVLPLWNLPLIHKIRKRRSSMDISLHWAVGVWTCLILMFPSAILSKDVVFKTFSFMNIVLFSIVMVDVVRFRKG